MYSFLFWSVFEGEMEIILDELQKVDIDMRTSSHHVNYLLEKHGDIYQSIVSRCPDLVTIFYEIDVVNFGRAMAYLTLVYLTRVSGDETRVAVQLVAKRLLSSRSKKVFLTK